MDEDADSFATIEWIRLLATYAAIHVAIHGLSRLKRLFRSEHVDSHVPDMTTPARGGSSRDRQANGHAGMGTYDALKSQCVPKAPVHVRRTHSFGLDPEELAEHVVYTVDHAVPLPGRRLETSDSDTEGEDQGDVCGPQGSPQGVSQGGPQGVSQGGLRNATTRRHLRALYRTRDFKAWCVRNKLNSESLQAIFQRMHLYKKLREIHPSSFWALCSPESLEGVDVGEVGAWARVAEYVCSRCVDLSAAYLIYTLPKSLISMIVSYVLVVRPWARGRSSCAWLFRAWYARTEEAALEVGLFRSAIANVLEDVFVVGSLGVGGLLSLKGLAFPGGGETPCRQSTGERVAGVVQVKVVPLRRSTM